MKKNYPTFEEYNKKFKIDDELLSRLRQYAERDSVKPKDKEEFEKSLPQISLQMKALLARDLWDMSQFYEIFNPTDETVMKGLEIIQSKHFDLPDK
jgi:carboxyl-terminal processing protease